MIKAWHQDHVMRLPRTLGLAVVATAVAILTASCSGGQPDPDSYDFVNGRGDP